MDANAPDVVAALLDAGARVVNPLRDAPAEVTGGFREGDESHDAVTARRPVAEAAIARVAAVSNDLEVRRGVGVVGLLSGDATATEVLARPGVFERVVEVGSTWRQDQLPGPSRDELVALASQA